MTDRPISDWLERSTCAQLRDLTAAEPFTSAGLRVMAAARAELQRRELDMNECHMCGKIGPCLLGGGDNAR